MVSFSFFLLEWRLKFLAINSLIEINNLFFAIKQMSLCQAAVYVPALSTSIMTMYSELLHHNSDFALGQTSNVVILSASSAIPPPG